MKKKSLFLNVSGFILLCCSTASLAHGVIESPASREQFCGVECKPHEIFQPQLTHEKCRSILTNEDGSMNNTIYNFMGVLTHTTGRQGRTAANLPKNVCGFDSETWGGGKTPWDKANDWPTTKIAAGTNKFTWNISWGNHFGDTEEFVFYITKPDFVFDKNKELSWDDLESTPFCLLKYDDKTPNGNPDIVADKANNRFHVTCNVPERANRSVIYAEWGRNRWTFERFHSCMDVVFGTDDNPPPTPPQITAKIGNIPSAVVGYSEIILDGSGSQGDNLSYLWSFTAKDTEHYSIIDANKAQARLILSEPDAEQNVTITLKVSEGGFSNTATKELRHSPSQASTWNLIGDTNINEQFAAGDKVWLRLIDQDGYDHYIPDNGVVLDANTAKPANWAYALAASVNGLNSYSVMVGVLDTASSTVEPIRSATANKIYVTMNGNIKNAYVKFEKKDQPAPQSCRVQRRGGSNPWWMGYDIFSDKTPIVLDFEDTGINLSKVTVDSGVFFEVQKLSNTKLLINRKPEWVSNTNPGYIGFKANNYAPLATNIIASCQAG